MGNKERTLFYGKGDVFVYRTYAGKLAGLPTIPESAFTGRDNVIFALNVHFSVYGDAFFASFAEGDNRLVVATDSMKNFILRHAALYDGCTMEGYLAFVSRRFLETYTQADSVCISANRLEFEPTWVPGENGSGPTESGLVYRHSRNEHASAAITACRTETGIELAECSSGINNLHLIKVKGSSFYGFVRDEYTTLPEAKDRPLYIYLDIGWTYSDLADSLKGEPGKYVPPEQVRDIAHCVFHEFNTPSIQNLIFEVGKRILIRFPQLAEVRFESNNRTWETIVDDIPASEGKVFTEPRPPYGFQGFSMTRSDVENE
ncbi:factor-independent urate hydroxylase [Gorillibacterium massiliense]|uniref:factor-independent urate hydroxylase n=1 Tax=Gorillibacterium massiliense TaxID=1280390 RepID=UPI0004B3189B|nr:urate oxidase [Gorillibacterium massiliense]